MSEPASLPEVPAAVPAAAFLYVRAGLHPIPACRPDPASPWGCACPWHRDLPGHAARGAGKTPLLRSAALRRALERGVSAGEAAAMPWAGANVALCLQPAGLAVVDLDGPEAAAEAGALGLPPTAGVARGDHAHRYYRLPAGVPAARAIRRGRSGRIDVLAAGYAVAPPSRHASGQTYALVGAGPLAPLPDWAGDLLRGSRDRAVPAPALPAEAPAPSDIVEALRSRRIPAWVLARIREGDRSGDRSRADWSVTRALAERGVPDAVVAAIYRNPDWGIGAKYRERRDPDRYLAALLARHRAELPDRGGMHR